MRKLAILALKSHIPAMSNDNYSLNNLVPGANAMHRCALLFVGLAVLAVSGCEHTVKLSAPDKPIVINLNVKIEREVRVKVEREIDDVIRENKEIF
jgi:hypothetical protein